MARPHTHQAHRGGTGRARVARVLVRLGAAWAVAGCPGGGQGVGDHCDKVSDCADELQCLDHTCVARCVRAPECGDGYACSEDGTCSEALGQLGDRCGSEVECAAGMTCRLDSDDLDGDGALAASCRSESDGRAFADRCGSDDECRHGLCGLGLCLATCGDDRDCALGFRCARMPRVELALAPSFHACIPANGVHRWEVPVPSPMAAVRVAVPEGVGSIAMLLSVQDPSQLVGAVEIVEPAPSRRVLYRRAATLPEQLVYPVRHQAALRASSFMLPPSPDVPVVAGAYDVTVSSFRASGAQGSARPRAEILAKMDDGVVLDLHFHFLDLAEHPCRDAFDEGGLDAERAQRSVSFQTAYVGQLRALFARAGVALGRVTYSDLPDHPDLDGLDASELHTLLAVPTTSGGVNVVLARTISPAGLMALHGGSPGDPAAGTTSSGGVAIGVDTLCLRDWRQLARITAHAIARHMGLPRNREPDGSSDAIADSPDSADNLLFYSELGGTDLSPHQRELLRRSLVLR